MQNFTSHRVANYAHGYSHSQGSKPGKEKDGTSLKANCTPSERFMQCASLSSSCCMLTKSYPFCEVEGYKLVHLGISRSAIQAAALAHQRKHPTCKGVLIALNDYEIKSGCIWCPVCHYISRRKALCKKYLRKCPVEILANWMLLYRL